MKDTKIAWCDCTFNPWIGCTKVSPGCANCYAERDFDLRKHVARWGAGQPRHRTSAENWKQPLKWNRDYEAAFVRYEEVPLYAPPGSILPQEPHRPRVFCGSLMDWLDDEVPIEWLADLLALIHATPQLDWLLLTKRPQNWDARIRACIDILSLEPRWLVSWTMQTPPSHVWIGTTVEDQQRADERIPALLAIPACVRFLSVEPMLGPVELQVQASVMSGGYNALKPYRPVGCTSPEQPRIQWVICGAESGPNARPMRPAWARSLRDQCRAAGVPFFFKQMEVGGKVCHDLNQFPEDLRIREFPNQSP